MSDLNKMNDYFLLKEGEKSDKNKRLVEGQTADKPLRSIVSPIFDSKPSPCCQSCIEKGKTVKFCGVYMESCKFHTTNLCKGCKFYGECDHQGAYQKDGKWCYETPTEFIYEEGKSKVESLQPLQGFILVKEEDLKWLFNMLEGEVDMENEDKYYILKRKYRGGGKEE